MQIDHALILCAGIGSRMGEIGKKLPKALWPVFYKELLDLQVSYCHELGIKRIFLNTHFLSAEIEKYINSDIRYSDITILHEDPLLDSGGAIHNMASRGDVNYTGNLLLVNADQFLFFDKKHFEEALSCLENSRAALFGIKVDKSSKYNETIIIDDQLKEIKKPTGLNDYVTYSGLGLLKLDGLSPVAGISRFFETVADYKRERVQFITPNNFEYWDFGTADIYFESIKNIYANLKANKGGWLMEFLTKHGAFNGDENNVYSQELNSISLDRSSAFERNSIVGLGIVQEV